MRDISDWPLSDNVIDERGLTDNDTIRKRMMQSLMRGPPVPQSQQEMILGPAREDDPRYQAMIKALKGINNVK